MIKILLADDHQLFRDVLIPLLNSQPDMKVVGQASSGHETVALSRTLRPNLILLDFGLPNGSGLEAMRSILADQPKMKIVFLTAFAESSLLLEAFRDGAKGYIVKDATTAELLEFIRGVDRGEKAISPHMMQRLTPAELRGLPHRKYQ